MAQVSLKDGIDCLRIRAAAKMRESGVIPFQPDAESDCGRSLSALVVSS